MFSQNNHPFYNYCIVVVVIVKKLRIPRPAKRINEIKAIKRQIRPTCFFSGSLLKSEMIQVIIPIGENIKLRIYNSIFSNRFIKIPLFESSTCAVFFVLALALCRKVQNKQHYKQSKRLSFVKRGVYQIPRR